MWRSASAMCATRPWPPSPSTRSRPSPPARAAWSPPTTRAWPNACGRCAATAWFGPPAPIPGGTECPSRASITACRDILCALGLAQRAKLDRFAARRRALAKAYDEALAPLAPIVRIAARPAWSDPVLHLMCVLIDFEAAGVTRREVVERLRERGVGTQVHYIPVHRQPYYRARYGELDLPGAEAWYERCLSLPLYPGMADGDVGRVVEALKAVLGG